MRSALLVSLLALACVASPLEPRLYGAWQSNRELTLAEFRKVPGITSERLKALSDPDLFGHLVTIYQPHDAIVIYEGECSISPYKVLDRSDSYVDIGYYDSFFEESVERRIFFEPGSIWLRVGDAREIFSPAEFDKLEVQHSCLRTLLDTSR